MINKTEISALIRLLDDPDPEIYSHVSGRLFNYGTSVIPHLEEAWEVHFEDDLHVRLEDLIHGIQYGSLKQELKHWAETSSHDLLKGALIVSRYQYPDLDEGKILSQIERLRKDAWLEMNYELTAFEQVNVLNHVMYGLNGFSTDTQKPFHPNNTYFNVMLETKQGNSISLGILYLLLSSKLEMPVRPVNLPRHFVLSFHKPESIWALDDTELVRSIIFYINPYSRGAIFNRDEITKYLARIDVIPQRHYFLPCDNVDTIRVMINSLIIGYETAGNKEKADELCDLKMALPSRDDASILSDDLEDDED